MPRRSSYAYNNPYVFASPGGRRVLTWNDGYRGDWRGSWDPDFENRYGQHYAQDYHRGFPPDRYGMIPHEQWHGPTWYPWIKPRRGRW